ncbi:50S ribosomal protein L13 [Candidatus Marinamargulisbacteria bacterium SCGC AG-343-D04]|nr:50S ribosomal protein L13 [Candidatus Marinamargulisbacteria bacterium SCGC AG-343-D04]
MKKQKTLYFKKSEENWVLIDASNIILGRLASEISKILTGKDSAQYTPSADTGRYVIVTNASKVAVSGNKAKQKIYYSHSRFPGGLKETVYSDMIKKNPEKVIISAVKGMLPKNKLARQMLTKLRVFRDENHNHDAQQPKILELEQVREKN